MVRVERTDHETINGDHVVYVWFRQTFDEVNPSPDLVLTTNEINAMVIEWLRGPMGPPGPPGP